MWLLFAQPIKVSYFHWVFIIQLGVLIFKTDIYEIDRKWTSVSSNKFYCKI